jgi:hypothetical protein
MSEDEQANVEFRLDGLHRNCVDSLAHALGHYGEFAFEGDRFHDSKWVILSVAHAVEVFCNLMLTRLDPNHPHSGRYPPLSAAVEQLQQRAARLSPGETRVIRDVFPLLSPLRNRLMHRPAPVRLEIGDATVALLSLLYIGRRRLGLSAREILNQHPPIEADVFEQLRVHEQDRWYAIAEQLVRDDYGEDHLEYCEMCGRHTLTPDLGCQACFSEDDS